MWADSYKSTRSTGLQYIDHWFSTYLVYHSAYLEMSYALMFISNDPSFRLKHPGVSDGSDGYDGTSYPQTENYTLPVAQATGRVAYIPPLHCGDVYASSEQHVCYTLRRGCSYAEAVYTTPGDVSAFLRPSAKFYLSAYCYISDAALSPYMFRFEMVSLITIQSSLRIHCLPLHLLRHYRISQV